MSLQIPLDLVQISANKSGNASERVRAISFLFYNVENLFPSDLPGRNQSNKSELASGIVSTTLLVGGQIIPTDENITLSSPIRVLIEHTDAVRERLLKDDASETVCVFWEFLSIINSRDDSTLTRGQWSDRGCSTFFNSSVTMCECSHLTHFAILLSPRPLNLSPPVKLSLQIIGYVGVSVSLVAMALTIITFLVLKPLRNMRNLIHVNLCISLGIAQLIFVIGVSRSDPTSQTVPVHCQIIAVLLHYFFLVSFMWMLMEGAVLYIILVKVFITNEKYYMLAFIFISYGVPALYMGLLTLPLGFALPLQPNYGYRKACFLNPDTNFMWAFIVPVIIIIFINIGFFIMAAVIMWHHKKKRNQSGEMNESDIRKWMIALVTLVVIMGLTWVFGILIVAVNALIPLAYIYTIMVAFQGLFIFLLFVVFPKQVRDEYKEWWKAKVKTLPKNSACTSLTKQNGTATTDATSETSTNLSVSSNGPRQGKNLQSKDEKQGKNLQSKDKNNEVILTLMVGSLHEHPQAHINLTSEESQN